MRQTKTPFGFLVGDGLALYYDDPSDDKDDFIEVAYANFRDQTSETGATLSYHLQRKTFNKANLHTYCRERVKELQRNPEAARTEIAPPTTKQKNRLHDSTGEYVVFREPLLVINQNKNAVYGNAYIKSPSAETLYDVTRFSWKKKNNGDDDITKFRVVCVTRNSRILETYSVSRWVLVTEKDLATTWPHVSTEEIKKNIDEKRWYFEGAPDAARGQHYNGKVFKRPPGPIGPLPITQQPDGTFKWVKKTIPDTSIVKTKQI